MIFNYDITELEEKFKMFVSNETEEFYDERAQSAIETLNDGQSNTNALLDKWCNAYSKVMYLLLKPLSILLYTCVYLILTSNWLFHIDFLR